MLFSINSESGKIESYTDEGIFAGFVSTMGDFITEEQSAADGGPGSGNFGHKGRPGKRGGSSSEEGAEPAEGGKEAETEHMHETPKLKESTNYEDLQEVETDPNFDIFEWMSQHAGEPDDDSDLKAHREQQEREEKEKREREDFGQNGLLESEYPEDLRLSEKEKAAVIDVIHGSKDPSHKIEAEKEVMDALSGMIDDKYLDEKEKDLKERVEESTEMIAKRKSEGYTYKTHKPDAKKTRSEKLARWWGDVYEHGAPISNWGENGIRSWQLMRADAVRRLNQLSLARKILRRKEFAEKSDKYMPWRKNPNRDNPNYKPWKENGLNTGAGSGTMKESVRLDLQKFARKPKVKPVTTKEMAILTHALDTDVMPKLTKAQKRNGVIRYEYGGHQYIIGITDGNYEVLSKKPLDESAKHYDKEYSRWKNGKRSKPVKKA